VQLAFFSYEGVDASRADLILMFGECSEGFWLMSLFGF
jgi:hypothetical protein